MTNLELSLLVYVVLSYPLTYIILKKDFCNLRKSAGCNTLLGIGLTFSPFFIAAIVIVAFFVIVCWAFEEVGSWLNES